MTEPLFESTSNEANTAPAATTLRPPRGKPRFGRAAFFSVLGLWLIFILASFGLFGWTTSDVLRPVAGYGAVVVGLVLSVVSLVKREKRAFAIVTLCIAVASPLFFILFVVLAWTGVAALTQ